MTSTMYRNTIPLTLGWVCSKCWHPLHIKASLFIIAMDHSSGESAGKKTVEELTNKLLKEHVTRIENCYVTHENLMTEI